MNTYHYEAIVGELCSDLGVDYSVKAICPTLKQAIELLSKDFNADVNQVSLMDDTGLVTYEWRHYGSIEEVRRKFPKFLTLPVNDVSYPIPESDVLLVHDNECYWGAPTRYRLREAS